MWHAHCSWCLKAEKELYLHKRLSEIREEGSVEWSKRTRNEMEKKGKGEKKITKSNGEIIRGRNKRKWLQIRRRKESIKEKEEKREKL